MGEEYKILLVNDNSNGTVYGRKHSGIQEDIREAINYLGRKGLRWDLDLCRGGDAVEAASLGYDAVVMSYNGDNEINTAIEIRSQDSDINIGYVTHYEKSRLPPELAAIFERFNIRNLEKRIGGISDPKVSHLKKEFEKYLCECSGVDHGDLKDPDFRIKPKQEKVMAGIEEAY